MQKSTVMRLGGSSAVCGGALHIFAAFTSGEPTTFNESLYLVIDLSLLFGVIGIYAAKWVCLGLWGLAGFVSATAGTALLVGPDVEFVGVNLYYLGGAMLWLGLATIAVAWHRLGDGLFWIAAVLVAAIPIGIAGNFMHLTSVFALSGILFGIGVVGAGLVAGFPRATSSVEDAV